MRSELLAVAALLGAASSTARAQASPQLVPAGPELRIERGMDYTALERQLRELLRRPGPVRVTVPGGVARLGDFAVGTLDSLDGHLVVLRGRAEVHGRVGGTVVTVDGDIVVRRGGRIEGDAVALGGRVRNAGLIGGSARSSGGLPTLPRPAVRSLSFAERSLGLLGVTLVLTLVGFGLVTFARPALETVSDTVTHSFGRSFAVGLLAQMLALPTLGLLVLGLALTVVGLVFIPFAVAAGLVVMLACSVLGLLAAAHALGETWTRRRMALGVILSPNSYRYVGVGVAGLAVAWAAWALVGWVPVAGAVVLAGAALVTWFLLTAGLGASVLSRVGARPEFAGRLLPSESLTDEDLWLESRKESRKVGK